LSIPKLIDQLNQRNPELNKSEIEKVVKIFLDSILNAIKLKKDIEIRNFGHFQYKKLKENYKARNPKTNELIYKPERVKLRFNASKYLKKIINE
tara:strand:- start:2243 stop:2524 length:282 start_codon:yes stop_codon:yes gene_type:complete